MYDNEWMRVFIHSMRNCDVFSQLFYEQSWENGGIQILCHIFLSRVQSKSGKVDLERGLQRKGLPRLESLYFYECDEHLGEWQR